MSPRFNVIRRSDKVRMQTDKIDTREHLHITGREFTSEDIKIMSAQPQNGSNMFKKEEEKKVEVATPVVEKVVEAPKKTVGKSKK